MCFYRPTFSHTLLAEVEAGNPNAQFELGRLYFEGRAAAAHDTYDAGTLVSSSFTPEVPRNHLTAARLLQLSADQGHAGAQQLLEVLKRHTANGVS